MTGGDKAQWWFINIYNPDLKNITNHIGIPKMQILAEESHGTNIWGDFKTAFEKKGLWQTGGTMESDKKLIN